jgi:exodeoxyribonuclease VII small subunit
MSAEKKRIDIPDSFEERVARLEAIVADLEAGEAPLEESLVLFEEGVHLARACQEQIESARQRVEVLLDAAEDGTISAEPLEADEQD